MDAGEDPLEGRDWIVVVKSAQERQRFFSPGAENTLAAGLLLTTAGDWTWVILERVLGIERFNVPNELGSSHGVTRIIRQAYFESPAYVPLLLRAYELWRQLERETPASLLTITGGLMIGTPESDVFTGSLASARTPRPAG